MPPPRPGVPRRGGWGRGSYTHVAPWIVVRLRSTPCTVRTRSAGGSPRRHHRLRRRPSAGPVRRRVSMAGGRLPRGARASGRGTGATGPCERRCSGPGLPPGPGDRRSRQVDNRSTAAHRPHGARQLAGGCLRLAAPTPVRHSRTQRLEPDPPRAGPAGLGHAVARPFGLPRHARENPPGLALPRPALRLCGPPGALSGGLGFGR